MDTMRLSRCVPATFVSVAIVVALSACGGATPSVVTVPPSAQATPSAATASALASPTPSPSATATATPVRTVAGSVTLISIQRGYVDDVKAVKGDALYAGSSVRTDGKGALQIRLKEKIKGCTLVPKTRIGIQPSADVLLHYQAGTAFCETTTDGGTVTLNAGTNVEIRVSDPLFVVTVGDGTTRVQVVTGLVEVRSTETGNATILGPSNRADVFPDGGPTEPEQWAIGEIEDDFLRDGLTDARNALPRPDLSRPDPKGSPVLERIFGLGTIHVGIDERVFGQEQARGFSDWFAEYQNGNWDLAQSDPLVTAPDHGRDALKAGTIDLFITAEPSEEVGRFPLFDDPGLTRFWIEYDATDPRFGEAERDFVRNTVLKGSYGSQYRAFFDADAPFAALAEVFGLD